MLQRTEDYSHEKIPVSNGARNVYLGCWEEQMSTKLGNAGKILNSDNLLFIITNSNGQLEEISGPVTAILGFQSTELLMKPFRADYIIGSTYCRNNKSGTPITFTALISISQSNGGTFLIEKPVSTPISVPQPPQTTSAVSAVLSNRSNGIAHGSGVAFPVVPYIPSLSLSSNSSKPSQPSASGTSAATSRADGLGDVLYHLDSLDSEIRNPLTGIDSTCQSMLSNIDGVLRRDDWGLCDKCGNPIRLPEQAENALLQAHSDAEYVLNCAKYIISILRNQIDLHRLSRQPVHLQPSVVNLSRDILRPIMEMLYSQKSENVRVDIECPEDLQLSVDSYRMSQLLESLLGTAFRTTDSGCVVIRARIIDDAVPGRPSPALPALGIHIEATADRLNTLSPHTNSSIPGPTGAGAVPSTGRVASTTDSAKSASSLTLSPNSPLTPIGHSSITRDAGSSLLDLPRLLVRLLGGEIIVRNSTLTSGGGEGVGVNTSDNALDVTINLPLLPPATRAVTELAMNTARDAETLTSRESLVNRARESARNLRLLLVDPDPVARKRYRRALQSCCRGTSNTVLTECVVEVGTGDEAVDRCKTEEGRFDVILLGPLLGSVPGAGTLLPHEVAAKFRTELKMKSVVIVGCVMPNDWVSSSLSGHRVKVGDTLGGPGLGEARQLLLGAGADCVWTLPLNAKESFIENISAVRTRHLGAMASQLPGGKRVLLVDDSELQSKSFLRRLKPALPASWILKSRPNLEKVAVSLLNKTVHYDVIITGEVFGPGKITGSEFIRRLRASGYEGIMIGCTADSRSVEKQLVQGADKAWLKPPPANDLIVSSFLSLLPKLTAPEPLPLFGRVVSGARDALDQARVLAITAYNSSFDSGTKPKLYKKAAVNRRRPSGTASNGRNSRVDRGSQNGSSKTSQSPTSTNGTISTSAASLEYPPDDWRSLPPRTTKVRFPEQHVTAYFDPPVVLDEAGNAVDMSAGSGVGAGKLTSTGQEMFVRRRRGGGRVVQKDKDDDGDSDEDDY